MHQGIVVMPERRAEVVIVPAEHVLIEAFGAF
jgi:hypothetical protein